MEAAAPPSSLRGAKRRGNPGAYRGPDCFVPRNDGVGAVAFAVMAAGGGQGARRRVDVLFGEKKNYTFNFIYESLNNVDFKRVLALIWGWGSRVIEILLIIF
jgi:hypothetical protein